MRIQLTTFIACPADVLWSFIEEPEKQKLWMAGVISNESTSPGIHGVGSTFRIKIRSGKKVGEMTGEVTAHDRPHRLEVLLSGGNLPANSRMRVDYRLAEAEGKTRLDYLCALEAEKVGFFMRLMMPLGNMFGRMQVRSFMTALKREAEGHAGKEAEARAK